VPAPPRTKLLGRVAGLAIYLVSGEAVRNQIDIDFTQGGNEAIYPTYVPRGEIWVDDAMGGLDRTATVVHEMVERDLMLRYGWSYDDAHEVASAHERVLRGELLRSGVKKLDLARAGAAYRAYLADRRPPAARGTVKARLEREIASVLGARRGRVVRRSAKGATR